MPCIWSDLHIKTFARHIKQLFVVIYLVVLQWDSAGVAQKIRPPAVLSENVGSRPNGICCRKNSSSPRLVAYVRPANSNVARIMQFLFIKSADFGDNSVAVCKRHCFISVSSGRSASSAFEIYLNNWMMHTFGLSRICFGLRREVEAREINKGIVMHHS